MKHLLTLLIATLLLSACTDDKRVLSLLDRAETLMEASPDSASLLLHAADSTIAQQSEPTRMRHAVLLAEAHNKLYLPLPSDTIFQEVVDYYDRHGTPNQQLLAHYLLGCIYRDRNEAPQALQCYYDAIEKADTLSEDCDYMTLYKVYGQMAELYDWQYLPEEEIEALKEYSKNAHKAGDTYNYIRGIELQVKPYYMMDEKEKVLEITEKSHQLYVDAGMPQAAASVYPTAIHIYVSDSNYQEAYRLMKIFENRSELFDCQGNICAGREYYYYSKGNFYLGIGETDSAEYYYRRLLLYGYEYEANKGLLSVYQNMRQTDSITKYALLCEEGLGKMLEDNQAQSLLRLSQSYNYTRYQKIAAEKEKAAEKERLLKWLVLFTCCLIGLFLYYQYLIYRKKKTAELRKLETEKLNAITQLMEKNEEIILLKSSNDNIRKHLLATKQAEIDSLVAQIEEYKSQSNIINNKEKENALLASDKVKAFRNMTIPKLHQQLLPSESDWEQLIALTQDSLPLFYQKIAGEIKLTKQEIRTAILTRLDFTSGEIAVLLSTSPQRVTNIKERINLKLFGEKSATGVTKNLKNLKGVKQV